MHFYYVSSTLEPSLTPPSVPITSRAFLFGDHVYESLRTYNKVPFRTQDHYDRMLEGLTYLKHMVYPSYETFCLDLKTITQYAKETLNIKEEIYIRVHFGRLSDAQITLVPDAQLKPLWVYICAPYSTYAVPEKFSHHGIRLGVSSYKRHHPSAFSPSLKSGNYLNNVLGAVEANERGYDGPLFLNPKNDDLCEGSNFNIAFMTDDGTLVFMDPKHPAVYLEGVTQACFTQGPKATSLPWRYESVTLNDVKRFPYAFALSTTRTLSWVSCIEDIAFKKPPVNLVAPFFKHFETCIEKNPPLLS